MKLAVFFPGIGYHCDKPLLYYAKKLTQQCRYEECISLSYSYDGGNIRGNQQKMQQAFEALYAQAEEKLADVDFGKYSEILFISKVLEQSLLQLMHRNIKSHVVRCCLHHWNRPMHFPMKMPLPLSEPQIRGVIRRKS